MSSKRGVFPCSYFIPAWKSALTQTCLHAAVNDFPCLLNHTLKYPPAHYTSMGTQSHKQLGLSVYIKYYLMRGFACWCINILFNQVYIVIIIIAVILFCADLCHSLQMTTVWLFGVPCINTAQCSEVVLPFLKKAYHRHEPQAYFQFSLTTSQGIYVYMINTVRKCGCSCKSIFFPNKGKALQTYVYVLERV